ncbi:MAG TPA: Hsp20/alpha crystallin family protein [Candidatus Cloacimonadota bacterium]|nr:Hsp20/alpha crystallin family protein [Candidatus Cloacimonadota bacterium]
MNIIPYNKDREFKPMTSMLNIFDDFFNRMWEEETGDDFRAMPMDIIERDKEFELLANLPGFKKEDVRIAVQDNQLVIEANTSEKKEEKKGTMYRCERYSGNYRRTLYLPDNADVSKIQAKMENGVLKLTIPKKTTTAQKEITIE